MRRRGFSRSAATVWPRRSARSSSAFIAAGGDAVLPRPARVYGLGGEDWVGRIDAGGVRVGLASLASRWTDTATVIQ